MLSTAHIYLSHANTFIFYLAFNFHTQYNRMYDSLEGSNSIHLIRYHEKISTKSLLRGNKSKVSRYYKIISRNNMITSRQIWNLWNFRSSGFETYITTLVKSKWPRVPIYLRAVPISNKNDKNVELSALVALQMYVPTEFIYVFQWLDHPLILKISKHLRNS